MLIIWLQGIWLPLHGYSFELDPPRPRSLHGPPDDRFPRGRTGRRGSCPTASGPGPSRNSRDAPDRLHLLVSSSCSRSTSTTPRSCSCCSSMGLGDGAVRLTQPGRHHEKPAPGRTRRRERHDHHLPELGYWCCRSASSSRSSPSGSPPRCRPAEPRPGGAGCPARRCGPDRGPAAGLRSCSRRCSATTRCRPSLGHALDQAPAHPRRVPDRAQLLPGPDLASVLQRPRASRSTSRCAACP